MPCPFVGSTCYITNVFVCVCVCVCIKYAIEMQIVGFKTSQASKQALEQPIATLWNGGYPCQA